MPCDEAVPRVISFQTKYLVTECEVPQSYVRMESCSDLAERRIHESMPYALIFHYAVIKRTSLHALHMHSCIKLNRILQTGCDEVYISVQVRIETVNFTFVSFRHSRGCNWFRN
jgi:hypothetical protein